MRVRVVKRGKSNIVKRNDSTDSVDKEQGID